MSYDQLFNEIDSKLANEGVTIYQRPILAISRLSNILNVSLPMFPCESFTSEQNEIVISLNKWYENKYGARLKKSPKLGELFIDINNDNWKVTVPEFFGKIEFFIHPDLNYSYQSKNRKNILNYFKNITQLYINNLNDETFRDIGNKFTLAIYFFQYLEFLKIKNDPLLNMAITDFYSAQQKWDNDYPNYPAIKWDYSHFIEKVLKYELMKLGETENTLKKISHNLIKLVNNYNKLVNPKKEVFLDDINNVYIQPSARYGEKIVSRNEAFLAQFSAFRVINKLYED